MAQRGAEAPVNIEVEAGRLAEEWRLNLVKSRSSAEAERETSRLAAEWRSTLAKVAIDTGVEPSRKCMIAGYTRQYKQWMDNSSVLDIACDNSTCIQRK